MADRHCITCIDFITYDREIMKRHVAIIHGQSIFSTLQCGVCKQKYYDLVHFRNHFQETPTCSSEFLMIKQVPLSQDVEKAFISLVDQMMKPVQVQSGPSIGGQSSATGTLATNQESAPSENQTSSVERPSADLKMEGNENSEIPKIISVTSLAHERSNIGQSSTMDFENGVQCEIPVEMDKQQHFAKENFMEHEDGSDILNRDAAKPAGQSTVQVPTADGNGNGDMQEQARCKTSEDDLRRHCLQVIDTRQRENRLICLLCKRSIGIFSNGDPQYLAVLDHAQCHLPSPIFNCMKCEFKSHASWTMWMHMNDQHSESMNQYMDTTSDRIDELMKLVSRCFDHGFKAVTSQVVRLISVRRQEIETSRAIIMANKTTLVTDHGYSSNSGSSTMHGNMSKTDGRVSIGQKRIKRVFSERSSMTSWQVLKAKRACYARVKEFVTNDRLFCRLCSKCISVAQAEQGYRMEIALRHCTTHMEIFDLFECSSCHTVTKTKMSMYDHIKICRQGAKLIDHFNQYYREILNQFLSCFDLKSNGDASEQVTFKSMDNKRGTPAMGEEDERTGEGRSALNPMGSTEEANNYLVCGKCGYTTAIKQIFMLHQKIVHAE